MIVRTVAALLFIALALPQTVRADEAITGKVLLQTGKTNTGDTLAYPTGTP
jgi:hypothetical protein